MAQLKSLVVADSARIAGNLYTNGTLNVTGDSNLNGNTTVKGILMLTRTTDAEAATDNGPCLIVGGTRTQAHLEMDGNEIMAKNNATSTGSLYLNNNGGDVYINNTRVPKITKGTGNPSGGSDGDVYLKYE